MIRESEMTKSLHGPDVGLGTAKDVSLLMVPTQLK